MKKQFTYCLFIVLSFIISGSVYAQCIGDITTVHINSKAVGRDVTFTDPLTNSSKTSYAGTLNSTMDGNYMPVYCVNLHRTVSLPDNNYTDTCNYVDPKIQYILNNYYPYKRGYAGQLPDSTDEAGSIQMAIWHYSDNVNANTITSNTVKNRTNQIIADADANGTATEPVITFTIEASSDPDAFFVRTVDVNDVGIAVSNISLSISQGSLSTNTTSTNSSGISPDITVTGTSTGIITATANMIYSQGRIVHSRTSNKQSLTIAYPVYGMMKVTADWGALPVELSSFNGVSNGTSISLFWSTATEQNNSHFSVERKSVNSEVWNTVGRVEGHGTTSISHEYTFTDRNLTSGRYNYRLKQTDFNGNFEYYKLNTDVEVGTPTEFDLSQNYPNPFNPSTKINYSMPSDGLVSIKVFDNLGRQVATLVNETKTAGFHSVEFNGANLNSGLYYYKMEVKGITKVMKMTLVK
ncbi:MAG: Cys-Gln thioester bond-forming surface protein [Ignavibacteria bacterium]|nr:Cys-Gln thioester bond-forming surface protein [Ignavibacteria bacterium]